jgi:hypothetical protein
MKRDNIIYWISTGLFAAMMLMSGITNILVVPDAMKIFSDLGYPTYLIPFLGWAKALGAVAILVPGYPRLKEWAYAGLFYDLLGASYSGISVSGFQPEMASMILFFGLLFLSYAYHHKRMKATSGPVAQGVAA